MLARKYLEDIKRKKAGLKQSIERQRTTIEAYDKGHHESNDVELHDTEFDRYLEFTKELERMKRQLQILRLEPDGFVLSKGNAKVLLEISGRGEMMFFKVVPTVDPIITPEMASFAYCKLELGDDGGFEVRYMETKKYIDELKMVVPKYTQGTDISAKIFSKINEVFPSNPPPNVPPATPVEPDSIKFEWKNGTDIFSTSDPHELVEVIGCHLNKYKKSSVVEVNKLKDLYDLKLVPYDSSSKEHEERLMRLWEILYPDQELVARKSSQWKGIGFQGTDPATDFRGMGLLGLHNLLYYAENHTERMRQVLEMRREYPFAVAGINITSMLLELLSMDDSINTKDSGIWDNEFVIFFCRASDEDTTINGFEEVYCMALDVLDTLWVDMDAKYMDFPRVLRVVRQHLKQVASARPTDWEDFRNRIQHILVSNGPPTSPNPVSPRQPFVS